MDAKLKFLDVAARIYAQIAPPLSAHLMSVRADRAEDLESKNSKGVCGACGTISIPGVTSRTSITNDGGADGISKEAKRKSKKRRMAAGQALKLLETKCLACHRVTKVRIEPSKRQTLVRDKKVVIPARSNAPPSINAAKAPLSAPSIKNGGSKRSKARKKGGLQALVERSKQTHETTQGSGLDLMDFMKEG